MTKKAFISKVWVILTVLPAALITHSFNFAYYSIFQKEEYWNKWLPFWDYFLPLVVRYAVVLIITSVYYFILKRFVSFNVLLLICPLLSAATILLIGITVGIFPSGFAEWFVRFLAFLFSVFLVMQISRYYPPNGAPKKGKMS